LIPPKNRELVPDQVARSRAVARELDSIMKFGLNEAKTPNPLKFAGDVPNSPSDLSVSGPKFTILCMKTRGEDIAV